MPGKQLDAAIHEDHPFLFLRLRVGVPRMSHADVTWLDTCC